MAKVEDMLSEPMKAVLKRLAEQNAGKPSRYEMSFPEARRALELERRWWNEGAPRDIQARSRSLPIGAHRVLVRHYRPAQAASHSSLIYLHGGGWCVGSWRTHDSLLRRLAKVLGREVIAIDYALAPEFPFPRAVEDVRYAIDRLIGDGRTWLLAGDSAGANLALVDCMARRDRGVQMPDALILFYGSYGPLASSESMLRWGMGGYGLTYAALHRYANTYCPAAVEPEPGTGLRGALYPAEAALDRLPRTLIVAAQCDPLLDQSSALAKALSESGTSFDYHVAEGVIHGYLNFGRLLPEVDSTLIRVRAFVESVA